MYKNLIFTTICLVATLTCGTSYAQFGLPEDVIESHSSTITYNEDGSTTHESSSVIKKTYPNKKTTKSQTITKSNKRSVPFVGVSPNTRAMWISHVTNHPEGVSVPYSVASRASMADLQRYHSNQHAGLHWSADTVVGGSYSSYSSSASVTRSFSSNRSGGLLRRIFRR